ncbi:MAG: glycine cleavage system protein H [Aerococcaceae bacterium]|nr:glycine cleavage system protein H [Aerococcaceae bacterium]
MAELWIEERDGLKIIGVTKEFQCDAGDISYVQIAPLGTIKVDDTLLNVEASKAAIEVPAPLSGEIVERNEAAESEPSLLDSADPSHNWIVKLRTN